MSATAHVVFFSGGIGSYIAAKRAKEKADVSSEPFVQLFTDTRSEDADLYRFLEETSKAIGGEFVCLADGRNLWELFNDNNMIANTRADFCSRILKRDLARKYIKGRWKPDECILYFGIDHSERHRIDTIRENWKPYVVEAPLCEPPYMTRCEMLQECERDGIDPPRLYDIGAKHNNCGGFCVKGGHAHFLWLLKNLPEVFAEHAQQEEAFRQRVGKDVAVMRDRRGGKSKPLPMLEFQRQVESGERVIDRRDWGKGCECFFPSEGTNDSEVGTNLSSDAASGGRLPDGEVIPETTNF
jgi:hypothetical protein